MFAHERQERIAAQISDVGRASVPALAELLDVTQETIRRDLDALVAAGLVRRVHGGAVDIKDPVITEASLTERQHQHQMEKQRIAQAALRLLPVTGPASIVIDAGTTTELFAEALADRPAPVQKLLTITNTIPIAHRLSQSSQFELELLGGRVRGLTSAAVGPQVTEQLERLRPDIAFIGANGLHSRFGLSTPDPLEAAIKTAMVQAARLVAALVDASKLGQETLVQFATLEEIDLLITDAPPPSEIAEALKAAAVEVVVA
ncbi:DeoR/GlpR family DNA-binding transcription regulator [Acaricomes phytoseiuli]|uniref:DeoR/GlpR family DNA-binding transcription regulator n=1 Tax=Acaricomes phytoseiuli TaxID=291968 RepID=UPI0003671BC9|nr:DeoR/GlpR family DNA-binding transcription regulator [Acaricomes phytoseiuli]MCW1250031.1 DeoR/GlpR family DNA-binding transcription regulator [Acaricomes phytoseiuli]